MTIEATLQSIDGSLISIAASLESLASGSPAAAKPAKASRASKATGKDTSAKNAGTKSTAGKGSKKEGTSSTTEDGPTIPDVRKALQALAKRENGAASKAILAKYDATTLTNLDESNYQAVIDDTAE